MAFVQVAAGVFQMKASQTVGPDESGGESCDAGARRETGEARTASTLSMNRSSFCLLLRIIPVAFSHEIVAAIICSLYSTLLPSQSESVLFYIYFFYVLSFTQQSTACGFVALFCDVGHVCIARHASCSVRPLSEARLTSCFA